MCAVSSVITHSLPLVSDTLLLSYFSAMTAVPVINSYLNAEIVTLLAFSNSLFNC